MLEFIFIFILLIASGNGILPQYCPANQEQELGRNEAIVNYFRLGYTAPEILSFLVTVHGVRLSLRQLRRILRNHGCGRRVDPSDMNEVLCKLLKRNYEEVEQYLVTGLCTRG